MESASFKSVSDFEKAALGFYKNDPNFKNNKSGLIKLITNPRGEFFSNSKIIMTGAVENGELLCVCMFICHNAHDAVSVSFFEARRGAFAAADFIIEKAKAFAKENNRKRVEISLDGHCNYSVGFSTGAQTPPSFGESYNPDYYGDFFKRYTKIGFTSFTDSLDNLESNLKFASSIANKDFVIGEADFKNFKNSIRRYTDLNNAIFQNHRFYFHRSHNEDFELFSEMKPLLKPCCLLFAQKNGEDAGFILMYPDFNELAEPGKEAGIATFYRHKILKRPISAIKIPEIGVLPEFQSRGAILYLFLEGLRLCRLNYPTAEKAISGWILDENLKSSRMVSRLLPNVYKKFAAYVIEL